MNMRLQDSLDTETLSFDPRQNSISSGSRDHLGAKGIAQHRVDYDCSFRGRICDYVLPCIGSSLIEGLYGELVRCNGSG